MALDQIPGGFGWDASKSRRIFQIAQYNWIIVPAAYIGIYFLTCHLVDSRNGGYVVIDNTLTWTFGSIMFLILVLPSQAFSILNLIGMCFPLQPFRLSEQPIQREFTRLIVCLVTRGDQKEVVERSVFAVQDLCTKVDDRISLHVLTEEVNADQFRGAFSEHVQIHGVPPGYSPKKAKYKARSLEWFRINMEVKDTDWILHVDEETIIDEYCLKTCVDFIARQTDVDMGVGVIHYNSHHYWWHIFPTLGDISRVLSDWGRIRWQADWINQVAMGVHGSFVLMSGAVENAVTWDTDIVTEDYWFCLKACKKGYRFKFIPAIARELSPKSLPDYIKQRKRWFTGMRSLNQLFGNFQLFCNVWALFGYIYYVFWCINKQWLASTPWWFFHLTIFEVTMDRVLCGVSLLIQDYDAGVPWLTQLRNQIMALWLRPVILLADIYATLDALFRPAQGFYVIDKL